MAGISSLSQSKEHIKLRLFIGILNPIWHTKFRLFLFYLTHSFFKKGKINVARSTLIRRKKDRVYLIIIVDVKMSIVLHHLELSWILIPRKFKDMETRKVSYNSSVPQKVSFPHTGGMSQKPAVMHQGGNKGRVSHKAARCLWWQDGYLQVFPSPWNRTVVCFVFNHKDSLNIFKLLSGPYVLITWSECLPRQTHKRGILYFLNIHFRDLGLFVMRDICLFWRLWEEMLILTARAS